MKLFLPIISAILFLGLTTTHSGKKKVTLTLHEKTYDLYFKYTSTDEIIKMFGKAEVDTELVAVPKEVTGRELFGKDETIIYAEKGIKFILSTTKPMPYAKAKKDKAYLFWIEVDSSSVCLDAFCVGETKNSVTRKLGPGKIPAWMKDSSSFYYDDKGLIFDAVKENERYRLTKIIRTSAKHT